MEKGLDSLMEAHKTTKISSIDKMDIKDYDTNSSVCEDGYCITGECTCDC